MSTLEPISKYEFYVGYGHLSLQLLVTLPTQRTLKNWTLLRLT